MTDTTDTICAISTPAGSGGIAVIRISGPKAIEITDSIWQGKAIVQAASHTAHLGNIIDPQASQADRFIDQAVAVVFRGPRSYTGQDTVELSVHGSVWIQTQAIRVLLDAGCRMAEPGEFTRRAFIAGHLDLTQAEAVADMIASTTKASHRLASSQMKGDFTQSLCQLNEQLLELSSLLELELDFSEEDVEFASRSQIQELASSICFKLKSLTDTFIQGNAIKEGIPTVIIGPVNAGKSTLLNHLLHDKKAIVSPIPGTTRDSIEDTVVLKGLKFRLIDTAGIRNQTDDSIEKIGIERALSHLHQASIGILLIDPTGFSPTEARMFVEQIQAESDSNTKFIVAFSKSDLPEAAQKSQLLYQTLETILPSETPYFNISAHAGTGIEGLTTAMTAGYTPLSERVSDHYGHTFDVKNPGAGTGGVVVTNLRHYEALSQALESTERVMQGIQAGIPTEFIAQDLRLTLHHLGSITGQITTPDILENIFSKFCVGK